MSSKSLLFDPAGKVIGIAGVMYPIAVPEAQRAHFGRLSAVIQRMERHSSITFSMKEMAFRAGLSPAHFDCQFKELLKMTPSEYLLSLRIHEAQRLLTQTGSNIVKVSVQRTSTTKVTSPGSFCLSLV